MGIYIITVLLLSLHLQLLLDISVCWNMIDCFSDFY